MTKERTSNVENKKPQGTPVQKNASVPPKTSAPAKSAPQPKVAPEHKEQAAANAVPAQASFAAIATKSVAVKAWQVALAVVLVLALVTGAVYVGTVIGNKNEDDPIVDYTGDLNNGDSANPGGITMPGYPAITFLANRQKVALELPNPSGNPCYFRYTLTIVETGEEIYRSELLEPGKALETITLNKSLAAGSYTLRIEIDTFSLADGTTPMNGGVQEVKLIVK